MPHFMGFVPGMTLDFFFLALVRDVMAMNWIRGSYITYPHILQCDQNVLHSTKMHKVLFPCVMAGGPSQVIWFQQSSGLTISLIGFWTMGHRFIRSVW